MLLSYTSASGSLQILEAASHEDARRQIAARESVAESALVLTCGGADFARVPLADALCLDVAVAAVGGKKGKKKKKNFTTPKHSAHKREKVKLSVLKHYSVEDGVVKCLRKSCIGKCPKGVLMAHHEDREHCGRCGIMVRKKSA